MKYIVQSLACLLAMSTLLVARDVNMPRGFFTKKAYETAKKIAVAEEKPIAVMLTKIDTESEAVEESSNGMIKALRNRVVWVQVSPNEGNEGLPQNVVDKFKDFKYFSYPFLALVNPSSGEILCFMHHKEYFYNEDQASDKLKEAVRNYSKTKKPSATEARP